MKLILAQGNPGADYTGTRHNIGFAVLDYYANEHSASWTEISKFKCLMAETVINDEKILLVKPTTFYNLTGQAARAIVDFYKLSPPNDLMVIHDDLALAFGKLRIRHQGRDAGNNGIKSLNQHLGAKYTRLRIGTANDILTVNTDTDFVLSKFNSEEQKLVKEKILPLASRIIDDFCSDRLTETSYSIE